MLTAFHQLPDLAILVVVVITLVLLESLAPLVGARVLGMGADKARDDAAFDAFKAIIAMVGFVLAFSLVQVNGNLRTVELAAAKVANAISSVDRILLRFGAPEALQARPLLANFGQSLIDDEWPALARGARAVDADDKFSVLSRAARAIQPADARQQAMFSELLKGLDDLSDSRESLIDNAELRLPGFFWTVTGGFLVLSLLLALCTEASLPRIAGLGGAAAGVGLLLAFVIIVDHPFRGQTSVRPTDIQKALQIDARRV